MLGWMIPSQTLWCSPVSRKDVEAAAIRVYRFDYDVLIWLMDTRTEYSPREKMYSEEARRELYDQLMQMEHSNG
jgi:hypothetical protein